MVHRQSIVSNALSLAKVLSLFVSLGSAERLHSFQSSNLPAYYLRPHITAFLSKANTLEEKIDTTFAIRQSLASSNPIYVSFEANIVPGYYLVQDGNCCAILRKDNGSRSFKESATFKKMRGNAQSHDEKNVSFESFISRSKFIGHKNMKIFVDFIDTPDEEDSNWIIKPPTLLKYGFQLSMWSIDCIQKYKPCEVIAGMVIGSVGVFKSFPTFHC